MVYIFFCLSAFLLSLFRDGKKTFKRDFCYRSLLFATIVLLGISRDLGGDKITYVQQFENCVSFHMGVDSISNYLQDNIVIGYMPLWSLLNVVAKTLYPDNFVVFQFFHAIFVNCVFFWFFSKYSNCKYLCVLLYYIFNFAMLNCEVMRESMSIACLMLAYPYLLERKWSMYIVFTLISISFHLSAVLMILFPFVRNISINVRNLMLGIFLSVFVYFVASPVILKIASVFDSIRFISRYSYYLYAYGNINRFIASCFIYLVVPFLVLNGLRRLFNFDNGVFIMARKYFLLAPFIVASMSLYRFFNYFSIFAIVIFANLLFNVMHRAIKHNVIYFVICIVIFFDAFRWHVYEYSYGYYRYDFYLPYTTFFDDIQTYYRDVLHQITLSGERVKRM